MIKGKKPGFTSVTVQMRVTGAVGGAWTDLGVKLHHFPFKDTTAPQTPGTPEAREYRAMGYTGDALSEQLSNIVTAVWAA